MLTAAILASGDPEGKVEQTLGIANKALLEIGGRTMLAHVLDALRGADSVTRIVVVTRQGAPLPPGDWSGLEQVACERPGFADSLYRAAEYVGPGHMLLAVTADVPLLTARSVDALAEFGEQAGASLVYSVADASASLRAFPGSRRTAVKLRDGHYTGGNAVLIATDLALRQRDLIGMAFGRRKSVVGLARLLGPLFVVQLALGSLDTDQLAKRASDMLQCTVAVWKSPYPEIGFDVDRPGDVAVAEAALATRERGS